MSGVIRFLIATAGGCVMLMLTTGCTSSEPAGRATTAAASAGLSTPATSTFAGAPASTPAPAGTTTRSSSHAVHADLSDAGHTVDVARGERLQIVLASTFWQFADVSGAVLRVDSAPRVLASPTGCVPGAGCGAVSVTLVAIGPGSVDVTAHRSSCGEAMGCTAKTGTFVLHVLVP